MPALTPLAAPSTSHTLPGSQVLQLAEVLGHWRIDATELLAESGLTTGSLEDPAARISVAAFNRLVTRARELTGEPALGIFIGLQRRVTMYGFLGFAAMSASTLREALELAVQFSALISTAVRLSLHVEGPKAVLRIEECCDVGDCRDVALFALILGLDQIARALTGRDASAEAQLAIEKPAYFDRFSTLLPRVRFGHPQSQLVFDAAALDLPLCTPDRVGLRIAREECERALRELRVDGGIVDRVRALIGCDTGFRSLDDVASQLRLSTRTLKRRLSAQGVSFSTIIDEERYRLACELVAQSSLPLVAIAERLGYSSLPNFARAFRRWTAKTPAAYRRTARLHDRSTSSVSAS